MELKDVVLQTLNELQNVVDERGFKDISLGMNTGEVEFLQSFKERIFVVFEGLKDDNLWNEELMGDGFLRDGILNNDEDSKTKAKLDLILGFLQFQLALLDSRLDVLEKRSFDS